MRYIKSQSSKSVGTIKCKLNIKPFITSVPSLETCHRFLIINSITLFHCGSLLPMSNPYPPDMIHMIDISKPFPFVAILLLLCLYCVKFIIKRTVHGRPGNEATLHQHNNLMLHDQLCKQCFGLLGGSTLRPQYCCESVYSW